MHKQLTVALVEFFSANQAARGRRDYYGVRIDKVADDDSVFDLTLTFKSGERYCCCEDGCHAGFALNDSRCWRRLREVFGRQGLADIPPVTIRRLHGVVEHGALLRVNLALGGPEESR
jgi:hypothetical protein